MPRPIFYVSLGYVTPSGNYRNQTFHCIAGESESDAECEAKRRAIYNAAYNRRKIARFTRSFVRHIGEQIATN